MIKCVGCNKEKDIKVKSMPEYSENGFSVLWDITNGLSEIVLCNSCANKVRGKLNELEGIIKTDIDDVNFTGF